MSGEYFAATSKFMLQQPANQHEIEEFRAKLQSAEQTIEKLRKKITVMDHVR